MIIFTLIMILMFGGFAVWIILSIVYSVKEDISKNNAKKGLENKLKEIKKNKVGRSEVHLLLGIENLSCVDEEIDLNPIQLDLLEQGYHFEYYSIIPSYQKLADNLKRTYDWFHIFIMYDKDDCVVNVQYNIKNWRV